MARSHSTSVHRTLHLSSPLMHGPDVHALQAAVKKGLAHYKVDWLPVTVDGQLGKQTLHAAAFYALILGLPTKTYRRIHQTQGIPTITEVVQRQLRNPETRTRMDRIRAKRRLPWLKATRRAQHEGPRAAVRYAKAMIGVTESPAESNSGPNVVREGMAGGISLWEAAFGLGACYWCLCFACYCVRNVGLAKVGGPMVNAAEVERMAKAHIEGWVQVPVSEARAGDIGCFCFDGSGVPDHGALLIGPVENGLTDDIDGNTSSDNSGSQSNGGGVFPKRRPVSELTCVARPLYS